MIIEYTLYNCNSFKIVRVCFMTQDTADSGNVPRALEQKVCVLLLAGRVFPKCHLDPDGTDDAPLCCALRDFLSLCNSSLPEGCKSLRRALNLSVPLSVPVASALCALKLCLSQTHTLFGLYVFFNDSFIT